MAKLRHREGMTHVRGVTVSMADAWELLANQISILCDGWSERREYAVRVNLHIEMRVETVTHESLITQLQTLTQPLIRPKDNNGGGGGGKPGSKPPGAFQSAALLDELYCYANSVIFEWQAWSYSQRNMRGPSVLRHLHESSATRTTEEVSEVSWNLAQFIRKAKCLTGHDAPTRAFDATVCGECGGQLRIAIDNVGGVFCAGTPSTTPCGTRYSNEDVIRLAMEAQ